MAPYLQSLFPFVAIFASQVASLEFTYPTPGKSHVFADGDRAIVQWAPAVELPEVFLNCSTTALGYPLITDLRVEFTDAQSGTIYQARRELQDGNSTSCQFCAGDDGKTCSGSFNVIKQPEGYFSTLWSVNGSMPASKHSGESNRPTATIERPLAVGTNAHGWHHDSSHNRTSTWGAHTLAVIRGTVCGSGTRSAGLPTTTANSVGWNATTPSLPLPTGDSTITAIITVPHPSVPISSQATPQPTTTKASAGAWATHVNSAALGMLFIGTIFFAWL